MSPAIVACLLAALAAPSAGEGTAASAAGGLDARLRRDISALEALARDELPEGATISSLFEVDLGNEDDVRRRVVSLRRAVESAEAELAAGEAAGASAAGTARPPDTGSEPAAPPETAEEAQLRLRRDRLRLAFLERTPEVRARLLEADAHRSRVENAEMEARQARDEARATELAAERARSEALERAERSSDVGLKAVVRERARAEAARATLAGLRGELAGEQARRATEAREDRQAYDELARLARTPGLDPASADALYPRLVARLADARARMRAALSELGRPGRVVPFRPAADLGDARAPGKAAAAELGALRSIMAELAVVEREITSVERAARWGRLHDLAAQVHAVNELRIELLARLSARERRAVLGFGARGWAQLRREVDQLDLMTRYQVGSRWRQLGQAKLAGAIAGPVATGLAQAAAVVLVAVFLRRRQAAYWRHLRASLRGRVSSPGARLLLVRWLEFARALAPELILLAAVYLGFALVGAGRSPELALVRALALVYAWYRVFLALVHNLLAGRAASGRLEIPPGLSLRILRSVRLVGRYVVVAVVLLTIARRLVGRGYLYTLVVDVAWLGALPIGYVLIRTWRDDIAGAYLKLYPEGRLADAVRRHRERRSGFLVTAVAFAYVATRGIVRSARDVVLRFRHARKAVSFLLERRSQKTVGLGELPEAPVLPPALAAVFRPGPAPLPLVLDHFPHLQQVEERVAAWRSGGPALAVALVGDSGSGKSTWLAELGRRQGEGAAVSAAAFAHRLVSGADVVATLARDLSLGPASSVDDVVAALRAGPQRLVLLDGCQNLVLRAVDGLAGFSAFVDIVGRTTARVAWVCAFARYPWEYADNVTGAREVLEVLRLAPWGDEVMEALFRRRLEVAGFRAELDEGAGAGLATEQDDDGVMPRGADALVRLLVDRSDGLPLVALDFWARALRQDVGRALVLHTPPVPTADALEALAERSRFVLTAVMTHEDLTITEAARVTHFSVAACEVALEGLRLNGVLERDGGPYRVSPFWQRAVVRYLRRKHFLYS